MGFPTKNDHLGVFGGYHHFRNPPYRYHHFWYRLNIPSINLSNISYQVEPVTEKNGAITMTQHDAIRKYTKMLP